MTENPFFDTYNGRIEDLFIPERKYTFLVGAGASMDSPTNMPSAREIVRSLLSFYVPNEEFEEIFEIDKQIGDPYGVISDLNNIGRIYETIGDFHEALTRYEGALQISTQIGQNQYIEMIQKKINKLESKIN